MPKPNRLATSLVLAMLLGAVSGPLFTVAAAPLGATSPTLGAAASYSVIAGSAVTNTGATHMQGDLGISPGIGPSPHYTGLNASNVGPPGAIHDADVPAGAAQADDIAAFTNLGGQGCTTTYPGVKDLAGLSLVAGVYCADAFLLNGSLTLAGAGVWIFKSAATLTTGANSSVLGGDPCNVWWRLVSSGTLGTGTHFIGNILASTSLHLQTGATLNGRAFAQTAEVTLDTNTITGPICAVAATATSAAATQTAVATQTQIAAASQTAAATQTQIAAATQTAAPTNTPVPAATNTPVPPPPNTPVPPATVTPLPAPTETETAPAVVGLPATGGGPLPGGEFPRSQALVVGGLGALALGLGVGAYRRRARRPTR